MAKKPNALLGETEAPPKPSPWAVASFVTGVLALVSLAATWVPPFRYLNLAFPVAIVCGHLALRAVKRDPQRVTGRGMALFGLSIGYFFLFVVVGYFVLLFAFG